MCTLLSLIHILKHLQASGHVTGMTGDGVNDAPALRQAEVGIAVSSATDVAKGAASVVLTEAGLTNIVALIEQGRTIYQRILTWIINKISRTILKASFVAIAYVVTGKFVVSAFAMLLLVFLTDFAKISLSTDNVRPSQSPETWKIGGFVTVSIVLGIAMVVETLFLLWIGWTRFGFATNDPRIYTFSFLKMCIRDRVIVDECHHVGAVSFDAILRRTKARFVLGLTATPIRRDGQQPIIFMQCGPIRYTAAESARAPRDLEVAPRLWGAQIDLAREAGIQEVFRHLAKDQERTDAIAAEISGAFGQGRKVLVLSERTEHLDAIKASLGSQVPAPLVLHGRMSKKQRAAVITELDSLPTDAPRILLASGKLVGEGFDHPPLDTLILAMPVSWKGTLQQYAGRLHREHAGKVDVRIIDFVDTGHPALLRMLSLIHI